MPGPFSGFEWALLVPTLIGCVYSVLCLGAVLWYLRRPIRPREVEAWPAVTILKPIHGLEKDLDENVRSACELDYPTYQLVLAVQRLDDPALPLLRINAEANRALCDHPPAVAALAWGHCRTRAPSLSEHLALLSYLLFNRALLNNQE